MVKADVKIDYYADLDLPTTADADEIKKRFRTLAKLYHPDRNPGHEVEVVAKFQAVQAAHEILSDAQQRAKYDADRARQEELARVKQEKAARDVLNALRRNAAPSATPRYPPPPTPRRATTGARGSAFNATAGRGRPAPPPPPPPPPPPTSGADKYAAFTRAGAQQRERADQEAQKAQKANYDAMRGFRSMKNGQFQAYATPPPPSRPPAHPTAPRPDLNTPPTAAPPRHHRSYEQFQQEPQPGFPGLSRAQSSRKPSGFAPTSRDGDEPMAQSTSAYAHHNQERRDSYFPDEKTTPHSPSMARREPTLSPLKHSQSSTGLDSASRHPQRPELDRISTRYAQSSGERTYVNGVGRSASVRNSPVEKDWGNHEDDGLRRPHSHHASTARHQSASPNLRPAYGRSEISSSESDSSSDDEPEDFASRPKAKPRSRQQKAGIGGFAFRHVAADDPTMHSQAPPFNHKHAHSPQDEYTARYVYPPPPPRSAPRAFPERHADQSNGDPRLDNFRQAPPNKYDTFHSPSRTWSEDWGFSPTKLRKAGPSLNGLPSWAIPSSVFPKQPSAAQKEPLETIAEEKVVKAQDWLSHANPRFNRELLTKADNVSRTSFSGVQEPSHHPYPQPGYQTVSQENINKIFSTADWDGKFNSGDEYLRPTEAREGKPQSRTSRTRARSVGKGGMMSPKKETYVPETIDLTNDTDEPNATDVHHQNDSDQPNKSTAQAFQQEKFSAEKWAAQLKDQTWAMPTNELNSSNPKTPKRPSKSTGPRRPTLSAKADSDSASGVKPAIPSMFVSDTAVPSLPGFATPVNGVRRTSCGGVGDAMDIDDTLSDTVPVTPQKVNEPPAVDQSATRNEPPLNPEVSLKNLANVAPFVSSSTGLKDMDDLSTALPFESRAAPRVNVSQTGSSSELRLPKPPKPISPPAQINLLSWQAYVADMNAYLHDWNVFNKKMIGHFHNRQEQIDTSMASGWISMGGDGQPPGEFGLDGAKTGYATFMAWLEEDAKYREWWNVANERNRQCFEDLGKTRTRARAAFLPGTS